jgi:hypothetical protein
MFPCCLCGKIFNTKYHLDRHKNDRKNPCNVKKEAEFNCQYCDVKFKYISEYNRHEKTKKHITNYNIKITNITTNITNIINNTDELKQQLKNEYEEKLSKEIKLKDNELNKMKQENELLKFNFEENIKINFDNKVEQELVPISTTIITHKTLNKIDMTDILTKYDKLLNITDLLYIINYDLNKLYIDKFWNNIESEDWIYLDEELINWFGYKEIKEARRILTNFIKNSNCGEYKILNNEEYKNMMVCDAHTINYNYNYNYKHILLSSDCFKEICFKIGTSKSEEIIQYYIEIEKIFKFYLKYTLEFKNYELEKSKLIKNIYINKTELKLDSILYLITTINKAKENIFKFGSTINEKSRKTSYNTGNVEAEKFFYVATYNCYDAITLEKRIAKLLINFKIPNESEMYQLHFTALDNIIKEACKNDNDSLNKINKFISEEYNNYMNLEPIIF